MAELVMVYCAAASAEEAEEIAGALLDRGLAACVQIAPVTSHYVWKGERVRDAEHLMIIKTRAERFEQLRECVRTLHSYETPEITAVPITQVDAQYREWVEKSVPTTARPDESRDPS